MVTEFNENQKETEFDKWWFLRLKSASIKTNRWRLYHMGKRTTGGAIK